MYKFKISTDDGNVINFDYEHGIVADLSPLSGIDVQMYTSQGFNQHGVTVENQSVSGISRTIKGVIFRDEYAVGERLLEYLPVFTTGKLFFEDDYFCEITIEKTPSIIKEKSGKISFTMMVFCSTPFWYQKNEILAVFGGHEPYFRFPINYAGTHYFGLKSESAFINLYNPGTIEVPYTARFMTNASTISSFGLIDVKTGKLLKLNENIDPYSEVLVGYRNNILTAEKIQNKVITNIFHAIDEESELFMLETGENIFRPFADVGEDYMRVEISYNAAVMGVMA